MNAIDLFSGAGGFSEGARMVGIHVEWAANHWKKAVEIHKQNHPQTKHVCQDLKQADWRDVPDHDIALASPACQGHSRAKGKEKAHHDALRATAWAVIDCVECHRSQVVVVENVPEFQKWVLYPVWREAMRRLGYAVAPHIVDSANHGVPQNRKRLFLICTRSRHPLYLSLPVKKHRPIENVIEWDAHDWSPIDRPGRSLNTLRRVAAGRAEFGRRFLAPYYSSGSGLKGRSLERPVGTLTTKDRWAVIDGDRMRMLQVPEVRAAMGFPPGYILPKTHSEAIFMLGNAVCPPVAADILGAIRAKI